jgi:hypothetical protein
MKVYGLNRNIANVCATLGLILLGAGSCKEKPSEVAQEPIALPDKWAVVPELQRLDIRYTLQGNGVLYVAAVNERTMTSAIYKTEDANTWMKMKETGFGFGAMTMRGDTLYVMNDSLYRYVPGEGWQSLFEFPFGNGIYKVSDMTFYKGELYAMLGAGNRRTIKFSMDGQWTALRPFNGYEGSLVRFCKVLQGDSEVVYVRPQAATIGWLWRFDGTRFIQQPETGLTSQDLPTSNAMVARGDSLVLGFFCWHGRETAAGGVIKSFKNGLFSSYPTDSLPLLSINPLLIEPYNTHPNTLAFANGNLFVGTFPIGVVEWVSSERKWRNISKGLTTISQDTTYKEFYNSISFIESFKGRLFVGYGNPEFRFWETNGRGLYVYQIPK